MNSIGVQNWNLELVSLLTFLTEHKVVIVGAAATISELIVIIVNLWRKLRQRKTGVMVYTPVSPVRTLLWAMNPINLFRRA